MTTRDDGAEVWRLSLYCALSTMLNDNVTVLLCGYTAQPRRSKRDQKTHMGSFRRPVRRGGIMEGALPLLMVVYPFRRS
jgi:hypothetical protein